jgi:hypothetical protein
MVQRNILLGLHDNASDFAENLRLNYGCPVDYVCTLPELIERARLNNHGVYIMDSNLGLRGDQNLDRIEQVYELVGEKVRAGDAKLIGISSVWDFVAVPDAPFEIIGKTNFARKYTGLSKTDDLFA